MRRALVVLIAGVTLAYGQSDGAAKGKQLKEALFGLRTAIDEYTYDHGKAPQSLAALVREHYLLAIPVDPMTGSRNTWRIMLEDSSNTVNRDAPGVFDVRSASVRYAKW